MAKKAELQAAESTMPMQAQEPWRAREDASRIMGYAEMAGDPARHRAAKRLVLRAAKHLSRKHSRGGSR